MARDGHRRAGYGSRPSGGGPLRWLTDRELEVLEAMAQGRDNGAIATLLSISVRSVEKHASAIFAKLHLSETTGVSKRVAAVLTYLQG